MENVAFTLPRNITAEDIICWHNEYFKVLSIRKNYNPDIYSLKIAQIYPYKTFNPLYFSMHYNECILKIIDKDYLDELGEILKYNYKVYDDMTQLLTEKDKLELL